MKCGPSQHKNSKKIPLGIVRITGELNPAAFVRASQWVVDILYTTKQYENQIAILIYTYEGFLQVFGRGSFDAKGNVAFTQLDKKVFKILLGTMSTIVFCIGHIVQFWISTEIRVCK